MPFEIGHTLSQGAKPKHIFEALMREVKQNPAKLKKACEAVLDQAANGDLPSLDWIACRLEGKAMASMTVTDDTKPSITLIRMIVVQPTDNLNTINELQPAIENNSLPDTVEIEQGTPPAPTVILPDGGGE